MLNFWHQMHCIIIRYMNSKTILRKCVEAVGYLFNHTQHLLRVIWSFWHPLIIYTGRGMKMCPSAFAFNNKLWLQLNFKITLKLSKASHPFPWKHTVFLSRCCDWFQWKSFLTPTFISESWHCKYQGNYSSPSKCF